MNSTNALESGIHLNAYRDFNVLTFLVFGHCFLLISTIFHPAKTIHRAPHTGSSIFGQSSPVDCKTTPKMPGRTINNLAGGGGARKRARRDSDESGDQDEVVDVRQASSSLQNDDVRDATITTNCFSHTQLTLKHSVANAPASLQASNPHELEPTAKLPTPRKKATSIWKKTTTVILALQLPNMT